MSSKASLCCNPGCKKAGNFKCGGCGTELYCSKECQVFHWETHKHECKTKAKKEAPAMDSLTVKQLKHIIRSKCNDFPDDERKKIISEMNNLTEKDALVALANQHIQRSEVSSLLSTLHEKPTSNGNMQANMGGRRSGMRTVMKEQEMDITKASPKQLREQAAFLRKNPALVRKQQPQMAHMTDAEIIEAANQLEEMANNPSMMKEFKENWSKLSAEERESLRTLTPEQREQIKNLTPEQREQMKNLTQEQRSELMKLAHMSPAEKKHLQTFQEGLTKGISDAWIDAVIALMKAHPQVFKTIVKVHASLVSSPSFLMSGSSPCSLIHPPTKWILMWITSLA